MTILNILPKHKVIELVKEEVEKRTAYLEKEISKLRIRLIDLETIGDNDDK